LLQNNITSFYKFLSPLALISILIFPILLYILDVNDLRTVSYLYAVYVLGTFFSAGYLPFQLIFTQGGKPEYQTMFMGLVLFTNVLLDFLFISYLGVLGASLAVAFTLVLQIFYIIKLAKKSLNIELWGYR
jgi:Na+-driven multidrug efflux pump